MKYLFYSRLILYFLAILIPFFHPAIAVSYDIYLKITLFILVPSGFLIAFYFQPPRLSIIKGFLFLLFFILIMSFLFYPIDAILFPIGITLWSYFSTLLIFNGGGRFYFIATLEILAIGFLYYKILMYTRSSEEIATISKDIINIHFILTLLSFIYHSIILYIVSFGKKISEYKKEIAIFSLISIPLLFIFAFVLPPDFVKHQALFNELEPEPPLNPLDGDGFFKNRRGGGTEDNLRNGKPLGKRKEKYPSELQNKSQRSEAEKQPERQMDNNSSGENHSRNRLEGVPSDQWERFKNSKELQKGKQMAVMIIASEIQPIYAAESYLSFFSAEEGFLEDKKETLNQLKHAHLISTWKDPEPYQDIARSPYPIFYLSTIKERVIAYRPYQIEPTIMDQRYHPFDLSYTAISAITQSQPENWKGIFTSDLDKNNSEIQKNLELQLDKKDILVLKNYLYKIISPYEKNYFKIVDNILKNYSIYQYKSGFDENTNIKKILEFLNQKKEGDCTEFSASTAILLRLAGIPTRVVYGWIASRDLQTPAHVGGLMHLRKKIPYLQKYDLNNLYLVTSAHHHAWIQIYIPTYGWVDIETTSYAKPPLPEFDPNARDVVIPLIEEEPHPPTAKKFIFPYKFFFSLLGILSSSTILILYLYKFILYSFYKISLIKYSSRSLRHINQYYYMKLLDYGFPKRKFYETPLEYAEKVPETKPFSEVLYELKFKFISDDEKEKKFNELKMIMNQSFNFLKPKSILKKIKFLLSLKGIFYKI